LPRFGGVAPKGQEKGNVSEEVSRELPYRTCIIINDPD
jgi:hypothetical protein